MTLDRTARQGLVIAFILVALAAFCAGGLLLNTGPP